MGVHLPPFWFPLLCAFLVGCAPLLPPEEPSPPSSPEGGQREAQEQLEAQAPLVTVEDLVTRNVVYTGLLEEGGVTIFQQGTHRLVLRDGRMVLLESAAPLVVLNLYVGKFVQVKGDVLPTVEAGGTLMKVKEIRWIRRERDPQGGEREVLRALCGGEGGAACPLGHICMLMEDVGICVEGTVQEGGEEKEEEGQEGGEGEEGQERQEGEERREGQEGIVGRGGRGGEETPTAIPAPPVRETVPPPAAGQEAMVERMAAEDLARAHWMQEYCSTHVGFCIPVHRNWYWKSFGATASLLWHVEVGAQEVAEFGDGPLVVDLKTGDLVALGVSDGDVKKVGGRAIGYRAWTESRHFEISAPAVLSEAVIYVTGELRATE
jgi:hypothetical protein